MYFFGRIFICQYQAFFFFRFALSNSIFKQSCQGFLGRQANFPSYTILRIKLCKKCHEKRKQCIETKKNYRFAQFLPSFTFFAQAHACMLAEMSPQRGTKNDAFKKPELEISNKKNNQNYLKNSHKKPTKEVKKKKKKTTQNNP